MELIQSPFLILAVLAAGALAGFINTLAGSGSLITLPMLIFIGLPANVANGTNRIGVFIQCLVGMMKFKRTGTLTLDKETGGWLIFPVLSGATLGSLIAVDLDEATMRLVIGVVMSFMLVVVLLNPNQWLREHSEFSVQNKGILSQLLLFVVGAYGGFIQAGTGVLLLIIMIMRCGFTMTTANGFKLALIALFNVPVLLIFVLNEQVEWIPGLLMAVGQSIGAWIAAHFASNSPNAPIWVRRLLITVILISILKLFGNPWL